MSNLTRLQAVSSSLDTAIGKANSLPNVGSGGSGGGSVTQGTFTVEDYGMFEPGINEYKFLSPDLNASSKLMISIIFDGLCVIGMFQRSSLDAPFDYYGSYSGGASSTVVSIAPTVFGGITDDDTIYMYGEIDPVYLNKFSFITV